MRRSWPASLRWPPRPEGTALRRLLTTLSIVGFLLTACGGGEGGSPQPDETAAVGADGEAPTVDVPEGPPPEQITVEDLQEGSGDAATPQSTVTVHYVGVLYENGEQFDSSWDRGQPIDFPLTQVVPGFQFGIGGSEELGIPPMREGGRRMIVVPPDAGYGDTPPPGSIITPGATLVFVVDLIDVR